MIDAHQHFWRLSRGDYAWPNDSVAPIFRDFGPDDLLHLLDAAGVQRTVLVQATDSVAETGFLLDLAGGAGSSPAWTVAFGSLGLGGVAWAAVTLRPGRR